MRENLIFYKHAYEDHSQNPDVVLSIKKYTEITKEKLHTDILDTQLSYSIRLYCYRTLGMTREWLLTDNITPAETAVTMMFASMPESLKAILF